MVIYLLLFDRFGNDTSPAVLSGVNCSTSVYLVILQCSFDSTASSSCTDNDDVSIVCSELNDTCMAVINVVEVHFQLEIELIKATLCKKVAFCTFASFLESKQMQTC